MSRFASYTPRKFCDASKIALVISVDFPRSGHAFVSFSNAASNAVRYKSLASSLFDTVFSLFGLCSHKVDWVVRVWQCGQTALFPRMIGGV